LAHGLDRCVLGRLPHLLEARGLALKLASSTVLRLQVVQLFEVRPALMLRQRSDELLEPAGLRALRLALLLLRLLERRRPRLRLPDAEGLRRLLVW
jgi:hypothetical protein